MSKYESAISSYASSPEDQARCETIVDMVEAAVSDRAIAVLDVGCSTGALLAAFKQTRVHGPRKAWTPHPPARPSLGGTHQASSSAPARRPTSPPMPRRYGLVS